MKKAFERVKPDSRIIIGYSASLLLLLLVYVVTLVANSRLKERTEWVEHTYKTIFALESFISKMKDAETGARGYYITEDSSFLRPYINSEKTVDSIYKVVDSLTKDSRLQQQRLGELKDNYKMRFSLFADFLEHTKNGSASNVYKIKTAQLQSKKTMDKIRSLVSFMQLEEKRLLAHRDADLKKIFETINSITVISLLLTLVLVIIGFVTYTNENKARKEGLQKIKRYQEELNSRIDELNKANAQLLQMRSMEKFVATGRIARTIAHEVRNPLTNIGLAASQLKADIAATDGGLDYYFNVIERNSERINNLISGLLQSTKFSELNFSRVSINTLLDEALAKANDRIGLQAMTVEKNYGLILDINVDRERMKIAFLNIIINAVEAMEKGKGILKISTAQENNNCIIKIEDNGTGMGETTLSKLFEPYFTSKQNGNGLGLANTQNIIFNHKGNISVSSQLGKGTIFYISIPVA